MKTKGAVAQRKSATAPSFMLELGLRIGEVCGLKWSDIDTKSKILTVQRTVSRIYLGKNNTRVEISTPKTPQFCAATADSGKLFANSASIEKAVC